MRFACAVLVVLAWACSAGAQDVAPVPSAPTSPPAATEPPADTASPAASEDATPSAPTDPRIAEALARFDDAEALHERGDFSGALAEMALVYSLLEEADDRYVLLFNLGRLYEAMHRYDRAVELYQRYLDEAPPDGADRADAEASLRALDRFLGTLVVEVNVPAELWIGGELVGAAPGEVRFSAGTHAVELRAEGYETFRAEVRVNARERAGVSATLRAIGDVQGISPAFFAASTGVAAVALGVGVGFGIHALSIRDGALAMGCATTDACGDPEALRGRIRDAALVTDVLYGTALLFAVTSVVLAFVTDWGGANEASVALLPSVGPGGGGLSVAGRF